MTRYDYKIASGYNNVAGLTNLEAITPTGDRSFFSPVAYSAFRGGVRHIRTDGSVILTGFPSAFWVFPALTRKQWEYLQDTYCGGAGKFSGKVTIRTRVGGRSSYGNFNAIMILPDPAELTRRFTAFEDVRIDLTRLVAIP